METKQTYSRFANHEMNNSDYKKTMEETAVDWLFRNLWETPQDKFTWYAILKKAKQMEKDQIIQAFDVACEDKNRIGREYYRDTYETIMENKTPQKTS